MPNLLARFKDNAITTQYATSINGGAKNTSNTGMNNQNNINDSFKSGKYESYFSISNWSAKIKDSTPKTYSTNNDF
jgi:hypothetical protein